MATESTIETGERPLRIAIAGGGTGGHISPAVAVIEELRERFSIAPIWIGSAGGYESSVAKNLDIPFYSIKTGKLRRYASFSTVADTLRVPIGIIQARWILSRLRPDVIFSTGGFVSVPSVVASRTLGIPTLTHEQTAYIGLATRINARFCDSVALSFERSREFLPSRKLRLIVTGNPVRQAILYGDANRGLTDLGFDADLPFVYVTGGAQGSRAINAAVRDALPEFLEHTQLLHQCGPLSAHNDFQQLTSCAAALPEHLQRRYIVRERIGSELGDIYAAATLVVGRSGAGTVNELGTLGIPALLIPLPGAEEQMQNALVLIEVGSAELLPNDEMTPTELTERVFRLLRDPAALAKMRANGRVFDPSIPARLLSDEIIRLARAHGYPNAS